MLLSNSRTNIIFYVERRKPKRSFRFKGNQFPLCARCTGILIGYFLGIIYLIISREKHIFLEILLMIPIAVDGLGQLYLFWESNNTRRLITGILAGISAICLFRFAASLGFEHGASLMKFITK